VISPTPHSDLAHIRERVRQKRQDYIRYSFSAKKNDTLKTFFDLAQEFDTVEDLYRICVSVPLESFGVESRLYLVNEETEVLELVCDSLHGICQPIPAAEPVMVSYQPYEVEDSYLVPIYCKTPNPESQEAKLELRVIGIFEVLPVEKLTEADKFFLIKYTNRIGYNLRKKMLAQQNVRHLDFIKHLVSDIEHNVIIPNMYFRHLLGQLEKRIHELTELKILLCKGKEEMGEDSEICQLIFTKIRKIQDELEDAFHEIDKHHINCSLFLESLFRRDHFEKGRFVLRKKLIQVDLDIIVPQLDHFGKRFAARGIAVEKPTDLHWEGVRVEADFGFLSQVYANLFSNAVKYTREIIDQLGHPRKAVAYGMEMINDFFGFRQPAIKFNVFTTGLHIDAGEVAMLFADGYKAANSLGCKGQGHGLAFVKYVIELHGGKVGYEATEQGNNFYFILPVVFED